MRQIKIFIASSAELDEDKKQFDLYFSEKNKLYRRKNIDFVQKTWKDFPSNLSKERLQNRYNEYIRECDIFIVLFHSRIGQYTMEELNTASRQYEQSGKKPLVYIYVKRSPQESEFLEKLQVFSEKQFGHFCDVYETYDDLFRHFDGQLQMLEDEGIINPDIIDIPKILRQVLLWLCPFFLVLLTLLCFLLFSTKNVSIRLRELQHTELPFRKGAMEVEYGSHSKKIIINSIDDDITISDMSYFDFLTTPIHVKFVAKGFYPIDSVITRSSVIELSAIRDNTFGVITGIVVDVNGNAVDSAIVIINNQICQTDKFGKFNIEVPIKEQKTSYRIRIEKDGFDLYEKENLPPSSTGNMRIQLHNRDI